MNQLLYSRRDAAQSLGISLRLLATMLRSKQIQSVRIARRNLIPASEIQRLATEGLTGTMSAGVIE